MSMMNKNTRMIIHYKVVKPLKSLIHRCFNLALSIVPMQNIILFESNPDVSCNSYEVYRYLLNNNMFQDFKIVWMVNNPSKYIPDHRTTYIKINPENMEGKVKKYILCSRSKILIDCNRHYSNIRTSKKQLNIYLEHGMPLKKIGNIFDKPLELGCDYIVSQAYYFNKYLMKEYELNDKQIFVGGVPRNDQFYKEPKSLSPLFNDIDQFEKIIAWVPTFRSIRETGRIDCESNQPLGMPIIYSETDIITLENSLKKLNVLLVIKPHPVQDLSVLKELNCHNIRVLYNDDMLSKNIHTNEFLVNCDAMITDYSGIYYDFLLTDRPIAITLDDYEEYKEQKGFVFDDPLEVLKGYYVFTLSDMIEFIQSVCDGKDDYYEERQKIKKLTNDYFDGKSCKRVCEFIKMKYDEIWNS